MNRLNKIIVLLGPPGSGKGTQAALLSKKLHIPHISTGDLFRENIKNQTVLGNLVKSIIDSGNLVPDNIVTEMLFDYIAKPVCSKGYLLDGFPRTLSQAESLGEFLKGKAELKVCLLDVPDDVIIKRIEGRQTCSTCGNMHNRYYSPSLKPDVCDLCQGVLIQRSDDKKQVVEDRLKIYHEQTKPLIQYYEDKGILHHIDGLLSQEAVFNSLLVSD